MGQGGEIFIFDMGKSVRIFDLAKNMIKLSGLRFPEDIDIKITGLRPGEKLHEELLLGSNVEGTGHPMIMRAEEECLSYEEIRVHLQDLMAFCDTLDCDGITSVLNDAVSGFGDHQVRYDHLWRKQGIKALKAATGIEKIIVAVPAESLQNVDGHFPAEVQAVPSAYPGAQPLMILYHMTGKVLAQGQRFEDLGLLFIRAEAVASIGKAVASGQIPTEKILTVVDQNGTFTYVSPSSNEMMGEIPERLVGKEITRYVHPDDRTAFDGVWDRSSQDDGAFAIEAVLLNYFIDELLNIGALAVIGQHIQRNQGQQQCGKGSDSNHVSCLFFLLLP